MGARTKAAKALATRAWRVLRGDTVVITAGRDKGLTGTVTRVLRKRRKVVVEGRNLVKKTVKRTEDNPGGIITKEAPLAYSNVRIRDPQTGFPVRMAYRYAEDGTKVRVTVGSRASGAIVPRPEKLRARKTAAPAGDGPNDTGPGAAAERTFRGFAASGAG